MKTNNLNAFWMARTISIKAKCCMFPYMINKQALLNKYTGYMKMLRVLIC